MGLRSGLRRSGSIVGEALREWYAERASTMAAALAFYSAFSLAPLLIIVVAVAGMAFGEDAVQGRLVVEIRGLIGTDGARAVEDLVRNAWRPHGGGFATAIGVAILLFGASAVFAELQESLNAIWSVEAKPAGGILATIRRRFVSFGIVTAIGFLLLVSLTLSAALSALTDFVGRQLPAFATTMHLLDSLVSLGVITVLFALLFWIVPDVRLRLRDAWLGAGVTSLLFVLGKFAIGFYIGRTSLTSVFGAAGSLVVILVWVYYSAQILLFGAQLTRVVVSRRKGIQPTKVAVRKKHGDAFERKLAERRARS